MSVRTSKLNDNQPKHFGAKTHFLNALRRAFMNESGERTLRMFTRGKRVSSFISKLVPNYYQYSPNTMRQVTNEDGIHFSLDISDIIDWFIYFRFREKSKELLLHQAGNSQVVIDVGANVGEISLRLALDRGKKIYSFEPDPVNFQRFTKNLSLNDFENIFPHQLALGAKAGTAILSTETIHNRGMNKITATPTENSVSVTITTLDEFVHDNQIKKVDFIKIDVEGFEHNVVRGSGNTIRRDMPILFVEVDDNNLIRQKSSASELVGELRSYGYEITNCNTDKILTEHDNFENCHFDILATPR